MAKLRAEYLMPRPPKITPEQRAIVEAVAAQRRAIPSDKQLSRQTGLSLVSIRWLFSKKRPEQFAAKSAKRRASKIQRTPKWADIKSIEEVYAECARLTRDSGIEHHVDHIVPLQGTAVCGLHVEYNLQILTWEENLSKGSRHE